MAGKVYAVMSLVQGNGAKYVASNIAKTLRHADKKADRRVLLVDFDFDNPYLAYDLVEHDTIHGIDSLVPHIYENGVSEDIFKENTTDTRIDVDVLKGTIFPGKAKQYSKRHIEGIIETARKIYDDIFIVISSKSNNAGTIYTLFNADEVILVVRNNYTNVMHFDRVIRVISQYRRNLNPIWTIYNFQNQYAKSDLSEKMKACPLDIEVIGVIENDDRSIDNIDLNKQEKMFGGSSNKKNFAEIVKKLT